MIVMLNALTKAFYNWLWRIAQWLKELLPLWLAIGVTVAGLVMALMCDRSAQCVRLTGMFLQLMSVGAGALAIVTARASFKLKTYREIACHWLRRAPPFKQPARVASLDVTDSDDTLESSARTRDVPFVGDSLERRIELLELRVGTLDLCIDEIQEGSRNNTRRVNNMFDREQSVRATQIEAVRKEAEKGATGNPPKLSPLVWASTVFASSVCEASGRGCAVSRRSLDGDRFFEQSTRAGFGVTFRPASRAATRAAGA